MALAQSKSLLVQGRVLSIRKLGSKLAFLDVSHENSTIQVLLKNKTCNLSRFDIARFSGTLIPSESGQSTVHCSDYELLTKCTAAIANAKAPSMGTEHQQRVRHRHLIVEVEARLRFQKRFQFITVLRQWLMNHQFVEVETPILSLNTSGAEAKAFETDQCHFLRIAPELHLKQLVVGGFDRVFELSKCFRNEGSDSTHHPEFTMLEMYQSYSTLSDMKLNLRNMLLECTSTILGSAQFQINQHTIDLNRNWIEIDVMEALRRHTNAELNLNNLDDCQLELESLIEKHKLFVAKRNVPSMLDKLISHFIEIHCIQPTLLVNHPLIMSPLAAAHKDNPLLSDRFELFIGGMEVANAYQELTDPDELIKRWNGSIHDPIFIDALQCGLPPTTGCGIGIDRILMLLLNQSHIKQVIPFPMMMPLKI